MEDWVFGPKEESHYSSNSDQNNCSFKRAKMGEIKSEKLIFFAANQLITYWNAESTASNA
jgi:hypothetical protein